MNEHPQNRAQDTEVEDLSRRIAHVVDEAPPGERDQLRDYAAELVREATEPGTSPAPPEAEARADERPGSWVGLAMLLLVGGLVLTLVVPPVGVVITLLGGVAMVLALAGRLLRPPVG